METEAESPGEQLVFGTGRFALKGTRQQKHKEGTIRSTFRSENKRPGDLAGVKSPPRGNWPLLLPSVAYFHK